MDAFAVSVCKGLKMKKFSLKQTLIICLFFGGFQSLMPLLGCLVGGLLERYIKEIDHWIAFVLLAYLGIKTIYESVKNKDEDEPASDESAKLDIKELFIMAIATSIDALAVGITFAFLDVNIWIADLIIGLTTFLFSAVGIKIGNVFGAKYKSKAEIAGGIILIAMGIKILLEHLHIIG